MAQFRETVISLTLWALSFLILNSFCKAEVFIQDVLWSREYEALEENYYGTCRFVDSPCENGYPYGGGVCVQKGKCEKRGGYLNGICQDGFGDCCTFTEQCVENITQIDVSQLVTTLHSLSMPYPNTHSQCSYRFRKEPNICQIKLDFVSFQMTGANPEGICDMDKLKISNSITVPNDFTTCGELTGQHMYLTFGSQDTIEVTSILNNPMSSSSHDFVATKIPCNSNRRVPDYCLQHFTAGADTVRSFDYPRQQQSNQQYTVCVKPQPQSTQVRWMPCGLINAFDITSNFQGEAGPCTKDWIQLKGGDKICDSSFTQTMSPWKPYDLLVNFDSIEFIRPPESFNIPITGHCDAMNCGAGDGQLICSCVAVPPGATPDITCQCTMDMSAVAVAHTSDFNNTGFCLEYSQF